MIEMHVVKSGLVYGASLAVLERVARPGGHQTTTQSLWNGI